MRVIANGGTIPTVMASAFELKFGESGDQMTKIRTTQFLVRATALTVLFGALASTQTASANDGDTSDINLVWNAKTLKAERDVSTALRSAATGKPQRTTDIRLVRDVKGTVTDRIVSHERRDADGHLRPLRWSTSAEDVELKWTDSPLVKTWRVSVDGKAVSSQSASTFEYPTRTDRAETFTIQGTKKKTVDGKKVSAPVTYSATIPPYDASSIGEPVTSATKSLEYNQDISAGTEKTRFVQWLSFIPAAHVDAPLLCQAVNRDVKYFSGDNRGFLDSSLDPDMYDDQDNTRARVTARVGSGNWNTTTPDIYDGWILKETGASHGYDENLDLVESKNAGTGGIKLIASGTEPTTSLAYRSVESSVALPLCSGAPAISWNYYYTARSDGWISVSGEFDQAPSTEIVWESTSNSQDPGAYKYGCWYRFNNKGFEKLAPMFPNAEVDLDANPDIATPTCIEE